MKCPVCTTVDLALAERQGVEIDYCPQCRGVWLDRGELDKIIERFHAVGEAAPPAAHRREPAYAQPPREHRHEQHHREEYRGGHYKRKSLLGELFDFD